MKAGWNAGAAGIGSSGPVARLAASEGLSPGLQRLLLSLLLAATLLAAMGLAGCAAPAGDTGLRGDPVTDSDETPQRKRARLRMELAVNYFAEGRTEIALDEIKQALAIDPQYAAAFNLRGLVLLRMNEPRLAEESFRRALALAPRDGDTWHNLGWMQCQQARYPDAQQSFQRALALPNYNGQAKTLMAQGLCQARAGKPEDAERSLARSYELDAANPVTGYNLARLLMQRGELVRAQFYIRRLNNSEQANAESLWLGIRVERRLGDSAAMGQLADQLRRRFPQSREWAAYERGAFDE